jgi:hypothetical protein
MKKIIIQIAKLLENDRIDEKLAKRMLISLFEEEKNNSIVPIWMEKDDIQVAKFFKGHDQNLIAVKYILGLIKEHNELIGEGSLGYIENRLQFAKAIVDSL